MSNKTGGDFRSQLSSRANLTHAEIRVRAAEVFDGQNIPPLPTSFRIGAEDGAGTISWVSIDDVGGLPRPFDRRAFDTKTKTMLLDISLPRPLLRGGTETARRRHSSNSSQPQRRG